MITLYRVVWEDAHGGSNMGWRPLSDLMDRDVVTVISCGAILHEDDEKIIICPHMIVSDDGEIEEGDAEISIPKSWVRSIMKLATFPPGD